MPKYIVTETVKYEVEAESKAAAIKFIEDCEDRDDFFVECADRYAERNPYDPDYDGDEGYE